MYSVIVLNDPYRYGWAVKCKVNILIASYIVFGSWAYFESLDLVCAVQDCLG